MNAYLNMFGGCKQPVICTGNERSLWDQNRIMSWHCDASAIDAMLFFFNIPEMSCISGTGIPSLAIRMGAAGRHEADFPRIRVAQRRVSES
jgi:hypothetical protein